MTDNAAVPDVAVRQAAAPETTVPETAAPGDGRHAFARPVPTPPQTGPVALTQVLAPAELEPPEPAPVTSPDGFDEVRVASFFPPAPPPAPASVPPVAPTGTAPMTPVAAVPAVPAPAPHRDLDPNPPRKAGAGTHVLGVLVGVLVGPVGAAALLLGQSRILAVQTDGWDADVDVPGIALVVVSALVLAALVLAAGWTAAAPAAGGVLTTGLGTWALVVPSSFGAVVSIGGDWRTTVEQAVVAATSGTLLVVGLGLLAAAVAASAARRAGVRRGRA